MIASDWGDKALLSGLFEILVRSPADVARCLGVVSLAVRLVGRIPLVPVP